MANEYLKDFIPPEGLSDYNHAARTFGTGATYGPDGVPGISGGDYNLAPRNKFLFYVYFNLNTNIPAVANLISANKGSTIGLTVKTAQLPSYTIDVATMNQYNRKRLVQNKINYNPCQIVFNDDHSDLIRNMWYQYYQYYYADPQYKYGNTPAQSGVLGEISGVFGGFSYGSNDIYSPARIVQKWGLSGQGYSNPSLQTLGTSLLTGPASGQEPFFRDITIYGMSQKTYSQYTMINPLITEWTHDTYDYSQGNGIMTNTMSIRYENVKYYSGAIGGAQPSEAVPGFANSSHYDTVSSNITKPGARNTVSTSTGIKTSVQGSKQDLQALNSGQNTLKNVLGAVGQGLVPLATNLLTGAIGSGGVLALGTAVTVGLGIAGRNATPGATRAGGTNFPTPKGVTLAAKIKNLRGTNT